MALRNARAHEKPKILTDIDHSKTENEVSTPTSEKPFPKPSTNLNNSNSASSPSSPFPSSPSSRGNNNSTPEFARDNIVTFDKASMATLGFVKNLQESFLRCSVTEGKNAISSTALKDLILEAKRCMQREENIVHISCKKGKITVVGDLHGQFHDLNTLISKAGYPDENLGHYFIFNGDYIDRGSWGIETLTLLLLWKLTWPNHVILLRGNHETTYCASVYGFENECKFKYSSITYRQFVTLFRVFPIAAVVNDETLVLHGGLFRSRESETNFGSLADLMKENRLLDDPQDCIVEDALWSDPIKPNGLHTNKTRGCGYLFGPDVTDQFMKDHKLKLIIRSHEGPDARIKRPEMESMKEGYTVDQKVSSGQLVTLFSAPDYPQFQACAPTERTKNKAAYIVLNAETPSTPNFFQFEAVERPVFTAFYDYELSVDSDSELGTREKE